MDTDSRCNKLIEVGYQACRSGLSLKQAQLWIKKLELAHIAHKARIAGRINRNRTWKQAVASIIVGQKNRNQLPAKYGGMKVRFEGRSWNKAMRDCFQNHCRRRFRYGSVEGKWKSKLGGIASNHKKKKRGNSGFVV
jgi:hypothetical protein